MDYSKFVYLLPYLLSMVISLVVAIYATNNRSAHGSLAYAFVSYSQSIWTFGLICELLSDTVRFKLIWDNFQYLPMFIWPFAFFAFALSYSGHAPKSWKLYSILSSVIPIIVTIVLATDSSHGLIRPSVKLIHGEPFSELMYPMTVLNILFFLIFLLIIIVGLGIIADFTLRAPASYRGQAAIILIGTTIPLVGFILIILGVQLTFHRDNTPFWFAVSNLVIAYGLYRYKLFNIVPLAKDKALDSLKDIIIIMDIENRLVDLNLTARNQLKISASPIVGLPVSELFTENSEPRSRISELINQESNGHIRIEITDRFYDFSIITVIQSSGKQRGRLLVGHDVTEQTQAAELLRKTNQELETRVRERTLDLENEVTDRKNAQDEAVRLHHQLNSIMDILPTMLIAVDDNYLVTHWNVATTEYTGIRLEDARGRKLDELSQKLPIDHADLERAMNHKTPVTRDQITQAENGGVRYWKFSALPLAESSGTSLVINLEDISEGIRMREVAIQTEKMLTIGGLAAGMAHEINNPLGIILQGAQNIIRRLSPDLKKNQEIASKYNIQLDNLDQYLQERQIISFLEHIRTAGDRASSIIKNMLHFSRSSDSVKSNVDVTLLLEEALALAESDYDMKKQYDFRHIDIQRNYDEDLKELWCNPTEIQQVLLNLFRNAAQAMVGQTAPPVIKIFTRKLTETIIIEIEDNGPGMDEETRKRVFEPFFTTKSAEKGTGLGLAVSYAIIVKNHNGTIEIDSAPGQGTRFVIELPLASTVVF